MNAFITVMGRDKVGIIAGTASFLAEKDINILDINQTIMGETFTMIMAVKIPEGRITFEALNEELQALGAKLSVNIAIRHEDIFNAMHRI